MMLSDPLRTRLMPILEACPLQAGPLYTSYKDLALSVEWQDLRALILPKTGWAIMLGHKNRDDPLRVVLPLPLHTTSLCPSVLKTIFGALAELPLEGIPGPDELIVPTIKEVQREMDRRKDRAEAKEDGIDDDDDDDDDQHQDNVVSGRTKAEMKQHGTEVQVQIDRSTLYLAIVTTDSTVVYYKLSKGIKKPADIPDE